MSVGSGPFMDGTSYRPASAVEATVAILEAWFGAPPGREDATLELAAFQREAVARARVMLQRWGGVLIADSVGLGKTYVALSLIEGALGAGEPVRVFVPASLMRPWRRGIGKLMRDSGSAGDGDRPVPQLRSHTWLSRNDPSRSGIEGGLVVVDEAHAFRTPRTRRRRALACCCTGARVVLLTATPVNNSVLDLYHLLRLFLGDDAFRALGIPDLRDAFRAAAAEGGLARLHPVLREVMVRRTRPFVRERCEGVHLPGAAEPLRFPRRAPPSAVRYRFDDACPGFLAEVRRSLAALELAPFAVRSTRRSTPRSVDRSRTAAPPALRWGDGRPGDPVGGRPGCHGAAELVRLQLLKRLESSVHAFLATVRRQLGFYRAFTDALAAGRLLAPGEHRGTGHGDQDWLQLVLPIALPTPPPGVRLDLLRESAARDAAVLRRLRRCAESLVGGRCTRAPAHARAHARHVGPSDPRVPAVSGAARSGTDPSDPKLAALCDLLRGPLGDRKVIIFTEYRDTARALWRALVDFDAVARIDGGEARLGRQRSTRRAVVDRFAPVANGLPPPPGHERVRVLVATDVLAEGLNLQDAAHVVSYDLPWNPVRLIQRVGRIDRLGSPHDVVHAHFFLPDPELESMLRVTRRLRGKLAVIGGTVGMDGPLLDRRTADAAGPANLRAVADRLAAGDATLLDEIEREAAAPFEAEERLRAAYWALRDELRGRKRARHPGAGAVPVARVVDADAAAPTTILALRTPAGLRLLARSDGRLRPAAGDPVIAGILRRVITRPADGRPVRREELKRAAEAVAAARRARAAGGSTPAPLPARGPRARLARRLLEAAADPALGAHGLERVDAALRWLARPRRAGIERALRRIAAETAESHGVARALEALESLGQRTRAVEPAGRTDVRAPVRPVAVLHVEPAPAQRTTPAPGTA